MRWCTRWAYEDERFREGLRGTHYSFDLNRSADRAARPGIPPQDLIVLGEVIEHLQVPPQAVMACLAGWLRPGGELLLQTPNAVSFAKRLRMLRGIQPVHDAAKQPGDMSGHVREYTVAELIDLGRNAGLDGARGGRAQLLRACHLEGRTLSPPVQYLSGQSAGRHHHLVLEGQRSEWR